VTPLARCVPPLQGSCHCTDISVVERLRFLLSLLLLGLAVSGCGGGLTLSASPASGYQPPPRQHPVLPESLNIHGCSSTTMGGGLVSLCDPVLLQRAWENHTLNERGDLDVRIADRKVRVASTPGLTQVVADDGGSLLVPAKVTLEGKASDGSYLYISARSQKPDHVAWGEALFRHLGLDRGGVATIDVDLDDHGALRFVLRRPDGSTLKPLRVSHLEGPGPAVELPLLPDHYADTPEQGGRTYVAAINARDGTTICQLWTEEIRKRFRDDRTPCWALATGLIDYGSESDSPIFERLELLEVATPFERTSHGVTFTTVPISVRSHYRESRYSTKQQTRDQRLVVWFRHTLEGWRIAKDPFFTPSENPDAPPGSAAEAGQQPNPPAKPSREELERAKRAAKEAEARAARQKAAERARERAAWAAALVRFSPGSVACHGRQVRVADAASDVLVQGPASAHGRLAAAADIRSASLAIAGRHVCFSASFASQPFGTEQRRVGVQVGLGLTYQTRTPPSVHQAGFGIGTNIFRRDGLTYAGFGGVSPPQPAATQAELRGNTLVVAFDLDGSFPSLRPAQLANLTWGLDITVTEYRAGGVPTNFHDQVPNNPHPDAAVPSPEVRQSDGKTVTPG
jgi:hypothetical protein